MKPRPRSVERKVAEYLSKEFADLNLSAVERIPVLGRTGPDISINELGLVIDVKSRLEVPKTYFIVEDCILDFMDKNHLIGVRLCDFKRIFDPEFKTNYSKFSSVLVKNYYEHMQEWTKKEYPTGITCIVLHRPKMPIGKAMLIISKEDRRRLIEWKQQ